MTEKRPIRGRCGPLRAFAEGEKDQPFSFAYTVEPNISCMLSCSTSSSSVLALSSGGEGWRPEACLSSLASPERKKVKRRKEEE